MCGDAYYTGSDRNDENKEFHQQQSENTAAAIIKKTKPHQHSLKACLYSTSAGSQRSGIIVSYWLLTLQGNILLSR